jgi:hypothetical protein
MSARLWSSIRKDCLLKCNGSDHKNRQKHDKKIEENALVYRLITLLITSRVRELYVANKLEDEIKMYDYDTFQLWFTEEKGIWSAGLVSGYLNTKGTDNWTKSLKSLNRSPLNSEFVFYPCIEISTCLDSVRWRHHCECELEPISQLLFIPNKEYEGDVLYPAALFDLGKWIHNNQRMRAQVRPRGVYMFSSAVYDTDRTGSYCNTTM